GAPVANTVARRLAMAPHGEAAHAQFVPAPVGDEDRPWLSQLLERVRHRLHEPINIGWMAREARMSERTLARRFAEVTGTSPGDWLIGLRVARAKDLLETSHRPIERIASDCGFGSAATLRHHCRPRMRLTPAAYRARFQPPRNRRRARQR